MLVIPSDPVALRAWRDATLYRLLMRASRAERSQTQARLQARGYEGISNSDTALLANLDTDGATVSALARRTGISRHAASQELFALERHGYIQREPDPGDGRALIVQRTDLGRRLLRDALEVVATIEAEIPGRSRREGRY